MCMKSICPEGALLSGIGSLAPCVPAFSPLHGQLEAVAERRLPPVPGRVGVPPFARFFFPPAYLFTHEDTVEMSADNYRALGSINHFCCC